MTNKRRLVAGLLVGTACCWSMAGIAAVPSAGSDSQAGDADPAARLQEITVNSSFISPGGKSALKMAVPVLDGYSTVDTGIYYNGDTFSASVKVSNILDKQYFQSAYSNLRVTPGDPRNFALTLTKVFD